MQTSKIKIAIADDHSIVRLGFISLINHIENCQVITDADNGKELIENIAASDTKPDLCILDISMPVLDGYATIVQLKNKYPDMRFLVLTMFDKEYSIIKMLRCGASGYLLKGCSMKDLEEAITDIHTNGYYYSNVATEKKFAIAQRNHHHKFSEKELQFLTLCCTDLHYAKIAEQLFVSPRTIEDYKATLYLKTNTNSRIGLALFAVRTGIVALSDATIPDNQMRLA